MFCHWAPELLIFNLKIGFLINKWIFSPQEMSRIPKYGPKMMECIFKYDFFQNTKSGFFVSVSISLAVYVSICLPACLSLWLSVWWCVCLSVCLSVSLSAKLPLLSPPTIPLHCAPSHSSLPLPLSGFGRIWRQALIITCMENLTQDESSPPPSWYQWVICPHFHQQSNFQRIAARPRCVVLRWAPIYKLRAARSCDQNGKGQRLVENGSSCVNLLWCVVLILLRRFLAKLWLSEDVASGGAHDSVWDAATALSLYARDSLRTVYIFRPLVSTSALFSFLHRIRSLSNVCLRALCTCCNVQMFHVFFTLLICLVLFDMFWFSVQANFA